MSAVRLELLGWGSGCGAAADGTREPGNAPTAGGTGVLDDLRGRDGIAVMGTAEVVGGTGVRGVGGAAGGIGASVSASPDASTGVCGTGTLGVADSNGVLDTAGAADCTGVCCTAGDADGPQVPVRPVATDGTGVPASGRPCDGDAPSMSAVLFGTKGQTVLGGGDRPSGSTGALSAHSVTGAGYPGLALCVSEVVLL